MEIFKCTIPPSSHVCYYFNYFVLLKLYVFSTNSLMDKTEKTH